jgi:hypothetical protein
MSIEVSRESLVPYLFLGILLFAALAVLRSSLFNVYIALKDQQAGSQPQNPLPVAVGKYTLKLYVAVKLRDGRMLWGQDALDWLLEHKKVPVLKPTRGDRPDHYDPVGYGIEKRDGFDEAVFYFDAPTGEWYWVWPTDCYLCTFKIDYAGDVQGATFIEAKGVWSYPSEW